MRALFILLTVVAISGCPATKNKVDVAKGGCTKDSQCGDPGYCSHGQCVTCRGDTDCAIGSCTTEGRCEVEVAEVADEEEVVVNEVETPDSFCFGDLCDGERDAEGIPISGECLPMVGSEDIVALSAVEFDYDIHDLSELAQEILVANAECLEQAPDLTIVIEGHADERGTSEYNLGLGYDRAEAVRRYLAHLGVDESRLQVLSKGEESPICADPTEECWSRNRRVDLIQVRKSTLSAND